MKGNFYAACPLNYGYVETPNYSFCSGLFSEQASEAFVKPEGLFRRSGTGPEMGISFANYLFAAIYIFVLTYAMASDFTRLIIPNWCSLLLVAMFVLYATINLSLLEFALNLGVALLVLALGFAFYVFAWFGAGDVKLLSAVMLWVGASKAIQFALLMAILGFTMAFLLLILKRVLHIYPDQFSRWRLLRRPVGWIEQGAFPYGIAICGAGLVDFPAIFAP